VYYTKRVCASKRRRLNGPLGECEADKLPMVLAVHSSLPLWATHLLMTPCSAHVCGADVLLRSPRAVGTPLRACTDDDGAATLALLCMGLWALQHHCGVIHNDAYGNTLVAPLAEPAVFDARLPDARGRLRACTVTAAAGVRWPRTYDFGGCYRGRGLADALEVACKAVILNADGGEREARAMEVLRSAYAVRTHYGRVLAALLRWTRGRVDVEFVE